MTDSRTAILGQIRRALGRGALDDAAQAALDSRLDRHRRGTVPMRGQRDAAGRVALFAEQAAGVAATVAHVADLSDVPDAVAEYLASQNLPSALRVSPEAALDPVPWQRRPTLSVSRGGSDGSDEVSVTGALCGIAETGTLVLHSGPDRPSGLNFLPDTHIVVLQAGDVDASYEDAWDRLRATGGGMPRTVNFITGPSRTGDIEQTIELGAHGPRRLHILLVGEPAVGKTGNGRTDDGGPSAP